VVQKNAAANEVIAGYEEDLGGREFTASLQEWSPSVQLQKGLKCEVKTRYRSQFLDAEISEIIENKLVVTLDEAQRDITPGQIAVFYQGDYVLGSAVIESTKPYGENK
jgi:tRNA-specific 2-thiouridylase